MDDAHATICSSYPYTLTNGQVADANQVMANFNCAALTSGSTLASPAFTGTVTSAAINNSGAISTGSLTSTSISSNNISVTGTGITALNTVQDLIGNNNSDNESVLEIQTGQYQKTGLYLVNHGASVSNPINHIIFQYGSTPTTAGSITSTGGSTAYNTSSDARLKTVLALQTNYRATIKNMWVGNFAWKNGGANDFGILAQQAYPLFPFAISKPSDPKAMWEADYGKLAPLALWGVKDLYGEVSHLWLAVWLLVIWNFVLTFFVLLRRFR